ncbi:MAG TPA: hypothetical protein VKO83_04845 [Steroidobacteraceae bacterium]|nr:hypothetical protein [Steroidobacteraceae bacterium]
MDATFIEQNQIIERYLAGRLPLKGAQDFERFCKEHPEVLTRLGMAERIHMGLRLMDASGQPEPWTEKPAPFYQKPAFIAGLAGLAGTAIIAALMLLVANNDKARQITVLQDELRLQPLLPARSTRSLVVKPSRTGPVEQSLVTIGGSDTEMADFKYDVSWSSYSNFRVTLDRVDQGRVAVLTNLAKDSNGHLRISLNSSAVGPGQYSVTLEGLDWRGSPVPQAWASFSVAH